jgi:hypothetical protein
MALAKVRVIIVFSFSDDRAERALADGHLLCCSATKAEERRRCGVAPHRSARIGSLIQRKDGGSAAPHAPAV